MFENLKQHITKENLHNLKAKNRYLEEQIEQNQGYGYEFGKKKDGMKGKRNANESIQSQDQLDRYEIIQKEEIFNELINKSQKSFKSLTEDQKSYKIFSAKFYTPQTRIKSLERSVQLSEQKIKLIEQYHQRQVQELKQKNQRMIQQLNLEIDMLKIKLGQHEGKEGRMKQLQKENENLKQISRNYEQKYWKYEQLQKQLNNCERENKLLKQEILKYKELINLKNDTKQQTQKNKKTKPQQTSQQSKIIKKQQQKIESLQKKNRNLIKQLEIQKSYLQQNINSLKKNNQNLEEIIVKKNDEIRQLKIDLQRVKNQKIIMEKSLLETMNSFSRHLANQSAQNTNLMTKVNNRITESPFVSSSIKENSKSVNKTYHHQQQDTIYLDPNEQVQTGIKYHQAHRKRIISIPVSKKSVINSQESQRSSENKNDRNNGTDTKNIQVLKGRNIIVIDPENNQRQEKLSNENKIARLEAKLKQANQKIVELIKQKVIRQKRRI